MSDEEKKCVHCDWIEAWQRKEQRKEELFQKVKENLITWALIGGLGYFFLILSDGLINNLKQLFAK
jgi:hypothetical protein